MAKDAGRDKRKKIIRRIERKRGSKVITYITSDRMGLQFPISHDVIPIIYEHLQLLNNSSKLDLFIYSRGGHSDVPWALVSMFREYSNNGTFNVLIPFRAHSAATVIALGADEIIMTKKAELGPIDITIQSGPYNPTEKNSTQRLPVSVEDVTGYFALLEKVGCSRADEKMRAFELMTNHVHPLALGHVSRLLEETKLVALRLLNTRKNPFSEEENHQIVKRISSEVYSHSHAISRSEAIEYIGLKQIRRAEEVGIDKELWDLYKSYREYFQFETPFRPDEELILSNKEVLVKEDLPLAAVESVKRFDVLKTNLRLRKIRQFPPNINLSIGNFQLPITLPNLPSNLDENNITNYVLGVIDKTLRGMLQNIVDNSIQRLVQSFPIRDIERFYYKTQWIRED